MSQALNNKRYVAATDTSQQVGQEVIVPLYSAPLRPYLDIVSRFAASPRPGEQLAPQSGSSLMCREAYPALHCRSKFT